MKGRRKLIGRRRYLLAATISLTVLGVLAWKADIRLEKIAAHLSKLDWRIFLVTLAGSALWHTVVGADKWWRVMRALGAPVAFWEVFRVRLGSDPIRFAVPMKAGELVNAAYFARFESLGFSRSAGAIVFDKSLNFFGTVFWLYVGAAAMLRLPPAGYIGLHTALGLAVLALLTLRPVRQTAVWTAARMHTKLGRLADGVLSAFDELTIRQKLFFLAYGVVFQLRPLVVCALALVALQPDAIPSWQEFLALGSIVVLMSNIPSLGGIGPREATLMTVFAGYADPATLLSAGLLMSFAVQVFPALLGIPFMFPLLRDLASGLDQADTPSAVPSRRPVDESAIPVSPLE